MVERLKWEVAEKNVIHFREHTLSELAQSMQSAQSVKTDSHNHIELVSQSPETASSISLVTTRTRLSYTQEIEQMVESDSSSSQASYTVITDSSSEYSVATTSYKMIACKQPDQQTERQQSGNMQECQEDVEQASIGSIKNRILHAGKLAKI